MWSGHVNPDLDTRLLQRSPNASCPETNSKQFVRNVLFWMRDLSGAKFTISDFKVHNETLTCKLLCNIYIEMRLRLSKEMALETFPFFLRLLILKPWTVIHQMSLQPNNSNINKTNFGKFEVCSQNEVYLELFSKSLFLSKSGLRSDFVKILIKSVQQLLQYLVHPVTKKTTFIQIEMLLEPPFWAQSIIKWILPLKTQHWLFTVTILSPHIVWMWKSAFCFTVGISLAENHWSQK